MDRPRKENMNISQKKMYQRLIGILPDLEEQEELIIHELLVQHIFGVLEKHRIQRILQLLDVESEMEGGSGSN